MHIEKYFEEKKGITVDSARQHGARYTAIEICRFARDFHNSETKALIEKHKYELQEEHAKGYNLGLEHGQQQGT